MAMQYILSTLKFGGGEYQPQYNNFSSSFTEKPISMLNFYVLCNLYFLYKTITKIIAGSNQNKYCHLDLINIIDK